MKTSKTASLILIVLFLCGLAAVPVQASEPTLADQLNTTINTVDWSSPTSWVIPHFSLIFNGQGNYDAAVPTIPDFKTLIQAKRMAEIDSVNPPILNQNVTQALNNQQMAGHWPNVDPQVMSVYWRFLVFAYNYAVELGANTSKWNRDLAFQEYLQCWQSDHDFLWFNPENGTATDYMNRYYDENAEVLSIFLKFYQTGVPDAMDYTKQMWTHLCTDHWSGSYFPYTGTSGHVECEAGSFAEIIAELYATNGYDLPNFPDYILQDLYYKFLSGGDWSAKLWSPGAYVVRHAESNPERRLENTVNAWAALHSYYCLMDSSMHSDFISLLSGSPKAWQGIVDYSSVYNNGRFRWRTNGNYSDDATCAGAMILFLNGIVPDSGSLAIPVIDETYQDWCSMFPSGEFRFDYRSRTIRIPVWQGKVNFIFGTDAASYTFPSDGVYEVHFSSDWNTVTSAHKVNMLDSRFTYIKPQNSLPVHNINTGLDYAGIQEAINAVGTLDGHTIYVRAGTYKENVVVNKSITLEGEDTETTIIYGGGLANTVEITADNVSIIGFTIENSSKTDFIPAYGCLLSNVTGCKIFQNNIVNNWNGILLNQCNGNLISENAIAMNLDNGISLQDSFGNNVSGNIVTHNDCGIMVNLSQYNNLENYNKIYHNSFMNNTVQAALSNSTDTWDSGYPSGGNYWSDYTERYPNAAEIDDSYIWNTPYVLDENNQDNYPLTLPNAPVPPPDTTASTIYIYSPASATYSTTTVPLMFTVNEPTSRMSYSLDGDANVTLLGNITLKGLPNGLHSITVYATDTAGNSASATVHFTVSISVAILPPNVSILPYEEKAINITPVQLTAPPAVSVNSPQNKTYDTNSIPLTFTVNESVSWVGYSLDGQETVTINGNTTLTALSTGPHRLSVSVNDSAGNTGTSEAIYFTVADQSGTQPNPEPSPTEWIAAAIISITIVAASGFLVYHKKIKKKGKKTKRELSLKLLSSLFLFGFLEKILYS
jgi:parallel beta-helix repeat protein